MENRVPVTNGVRVLRRYAISFVPHFYNYKEHGGTNSAARQLAIPEHEIIKTLVMETDERKPFLVLMHGDREVSTKQLARFLGVKQVMLCSETAAQKYTGYQFGGTSPFGTRTELPVYAERSIFDLQKIYINGGKRGFLVEIIPQELRKALNVKEIDAAIQIEP